MSSHALNIFSSQLIVSILSRSDSNEFNGSSNSEARSTEFGTDTAKSGIF